MSREGEDKGIKKEETESRLWYGSGRRSEAEHRKLEILASDLSGGRWGLFYTCVATLCNFNRNV